MATKLLDYIRAYDGMVDDSLCQKIIETFNESEFSYTDNEQRPAFSELNISQRFMQKDPKWVPIQNKLTDIFADTAEQYMNQLDVAVDFPAKYAFEEHRLKMYNNNGYDQFKPHVDVGNYNSARRFLVCFLYLNDVARGGETDFPRLNYKVEPKCGTILLFPATWQWRHAGLPPVSDKKYIVGTYLHYI
jgi:hypothetical protein